MAEQSVVWQSSLRQNQGGTQVYQANLDKRSLRSALLLGAASVAAVSLSLPASAQDQSTETVVVTGSRIPQQGLYAPSPVTAVGQQEMKFEGTTGVETLLNNLPSVFADQTSGVSNAATGTATVNLRDLGAVRTLVLVNGTRLMPGDPKAPAADLNQIPASLVDHVEVLTGGASAVYGSDALAGVVNFVMRKDFEGIELDGQYNVAEADNTNSTYRALNTAAGFQNAKEGIWDGQNVNSTLIMGTNTSNGKGNVTAYISYQNTAAVLAAARDFSACTIGGTGHHACAGSSNYNRFFSLDDSAATYAPVGTPGGGPTTPYDFFEQGTGHVGSGSFVPYTGANNQKFNYGALNYLQRPDTRYAGGFFSHYEVNKELDVYASFMFTDDHTLAQIAPSGLFLGTGAISAAFVQINCNNPLLTGNEAASLCGANAMAGEFATSGGAAGNAACVPVGTTGNCNLTPGQALLEIGRRDIEGGNRVDDLRHTAYRAQVGARGDLGDGWSYDVYAQYGYTVFQENYQNEFSVHRVQNALEVDPATGKCYAAEPNAQGVVSDSKCVPLDIFNGIGSITPAMLSYVEASGFQEGYTEEQIVSGNVTGDLGEYGIQSPFAKSPAAISFGSEYRAEYLEDLADYEFTSGDLYGQGGATPSTPRSGFNVVEGFTEVKVPLVQEKPFAEDVEFNAGYRYSSYSGSSGSVSAYKYGLEWQPIDDFRVRASYERAVRAPNVLEGFAPDNVVLFAGQDPCASSTAGQCASVTHAGGGILSCPASQCNQLVGGSNTLRPEIGDTRSIGVVMTPTFLDGFTATVDYFNIDVSSAISSVSPTVTLAECYGAAATAATEAFFCPLVHRNAAGQIYGGGFVSATDLNTGFEHTKGFDFEANYSLNMDDWSMTSGYGALQFQFVGTWLQSFETEPLQASGAFAGTGSYDCAGLFGLTCGVPLPKWRHRLRVTWDTPWDVDFSANWRYLSGVSLDSNTSNPLLAGATHDAADATINDFWYLDLSADWNVRTGVNLHAGVNNVFDRLPPTLTTNALPAGTGNDNTFPGTYDSLGRTFFIGATIKY
jgi:outer membrane receptor protein involved in Fe transport